MSIEAQNCMQTHNTFTHTYTLYIHCICCMYMQNTPTHTRRELDVDEVMVDASAEWKPVEKPPDIKDEDG